MKPREVGAPAPPLQLPMAGGDLWSIESLRGRSALVSFLGPADCRFCRAHVIRLIQARERIAEVGTEVVLVAYHDRDLMMARMMHSLNLPYVLLIDHARRAYADWGLGQVTPRALFHPGLYLAALRVVLSREKSLGHVPGRNQMGGDFLVDRDGRLAFVKRLRSFHDRAKIDDLLALAARL